MLKLTIIIKIQILSYFFYFPQKYGAIFPSNCGQNATVLTQNTQIHFIQMLHIKSVIRDVHLVFYIVPANNGVLKDPNASHFVSGNDRVVHDLGNFEELVFFSIELEDVSDVLWGLFGFVTVFEFELDWVGVDGFVGGEVDDSLLIFSVFANQVLIVSWEIDDLDICGYRFEYFRLLEEGAFNLSKIIKLDRVEVHLGTGNQQRKVFLIGGHDSIFDERVVFGLEVFLAFAELLHFLLLIMQVVVNQYWVFEHNDDPVA